jgi:phage-related protein (TIGR01555 family)
MSKTMSDHMAALRTFDGWRSLVTGINNSDRDKRMSKTFQSSDRLSKEIADRLYHDDDIAQRVAKLPATDRWREWVTYTTSDIDASNWIQQRHEELRSQQRLIEASIWANVHGGAIIYMGIDDGRDPWEPVTGTIRDVGFLKVFSRMEVETDGTFSDIKNLARFGEPEFFLVTPKGNGSGGTSIRIHADRVLYLEGGPTSQQRKIQNGGWPDSIYQRMWERLRGHNAIWDTVEILLEDFAQAVYKINGLRDMVADADGLDKLKTRIEAVELSRSVLRAMLLDAENEEFERKTTPLDGLPEIIDKFLLRVAAAAEMPVTLLFGRAPAGLNSTGQSDLQQYYDRIRTEQKLYGAPAIERLSEVLWQSRPEGEPDAWSAEFDPIIQISDAERAQAQVVQSQADEKYVEMGLPPDLLMETRFRAEGYSFGAPVLSEKHLVKIRAAAEEPPPAPPAGDTDTVPGDTDTPADPEN